MSTTAQHADVARDVELPNDQDASGRSFDSRALEMLGRVLGSGTLTATKGVMTPTLESEFAELLGVKHAIACSSGTAAIHAAVASLDLEPGDEVLTTSVTDMGALAPLLYQGLIPVFVDVDPVTGNVTRDAVEAAWGERTRAVIVTHLFGNPADVPGIRELAQSRGAVVIEDAAQAFLARKKGRLVGTMGSLGCFSFQQGKHITSGEGGIVVTDDDALAHEVRLFVNKSWPYGEPEPDHRKLGLNYRITELQSAVLLAQLGHLQEFVAHRQKLAARFAERVEGLAGVVVPPVDARDEHVYWRYPLVIDRSVLPDGVDVVASEFRARGVGAAPRYIGKPAFRCGIFADRNTLGTSGWPLSMARPEALDYREERFPGTFAFLDSVVVVPWNERFTLEHVDKLADSVLASVAGVAAPRAGAS
ncbi:MAG TPA: DegT/DnrJ/EryC1/StrS family aminotransferase [Propionibacteriaceae bacterium]|nr:DegT/DnrJ/EryC1/StrS family aminotransferase [Propionibacteriaceae bacterium]